MRHCNLISNQVLFDLCFVFVFVRKVLKELTIAVGEQKKLIKLQLQLLKNCKEKIKF